MKKVREFTRRATSDYFLVRYLQRKEIIGRVVNVSLGGLMLVVSKPLPERSEYQIQLVFPREIANKTSINMTVELRWCKYNGYGDWWEVGLEIKAIESHDVVVLNEVIKQIAADGADQDNQR